MAASSFAIDANMGDRDLLLFYWGNNIEEYLGLYQYRIFFTSFLQICCISSNILNLTI